MNTLEQVASTIDVSTIPGFIASSRSIANKMEAMYNSTPVESQAEGAAKILIEFGCA